MVGEGAGAEGWYSNNNNNKTFVVLSKYFSNIYFTFFITLCHCIYTQLMAHCSFQEVKPDVYCNNEAPNLIFSFFCRHYHQWISNIYSCISNKAYTNYLTDDTLKVLRVHQQRYRPNGSHKYWTKYWIMENEDICKYMFLFLFLR